MEQVNNSKWYPVYRRWHIIGTDLPNLQAVTPLTERRKVLRFCRDIRFSGHLGIKKTIGRVRQRFYWPGLQDDVRRYVNGCEQCLMRKNLYVKSRLQCKLYIQEFQWKG